MSFQKCELAYLSVENNSCSECDNLIVHKEGIKFYNGENKRDERSRFT